MSCKPGSPCYQFGNATQPNGCGVDPCHTWKTNTDLVFYNGANLPCSGVDICDTLTVALQKLDQKVCPDAIATSLFTSITNNLSIQNIFCTLVTNCIPTTTTTTSTSSTSTTTTTTTTECPNDLYLICCASYSDIFDNALTIIKPCVVPVDLQFYHSYVDLTNGTGPQAHSWVPATYADIVSLGFLGETSYYVPNWSLFFDAGTTGASNITEALSKCGSDYPSSSCPSTTFGCSLTTLEPSLTVPTIFSYVECGDVAISYTTLDPGDPSIAVCIENSFGVVIVSGDGTFTVGVDCGARTTTTSTTTSTPITTTTTTTQFDSPKCADCAPILDDVTDNGVGLLSVGDMTSAFCELGNYVIDWYLDSTSNPIEFTSGNLGNPDPAIQQFHPFTGLSARPSQGGSWIPVIRYAELDGIFYYSSPTPGEELATDLATCLTPVTVLNLNCENGTNTDVGFEQYSHKFQYNNTLQAPTDSSKTLAFTLNSDGSIQYLAWYFEGLVVSDRLTFTYVSPLNSTSTVLEDYAIGTDIPTSNFALTPKRLKATFAKYILDLTGIVYALGDYIQIDVIAGFINPLNTNTNWKLYLKCLETFDTTWTRTVVDDCSPTMTFEPSLCRYRLDIGFSTFDDNTNTDIYKYLVTTDANFTGGTKPTNALPQTSIYFGAGLYSCSGVRVLNNSNCTPSADTITITKTGASWLFEFDSVTDYNKYQTDYNNVIAAITPIGPVPPDTDIDYYRFVRIFVEKYNNDSCGDSRVTFSDPTFHYLTPVTFDPVNLTMSFTVTAVDASPYYATLPPSCQGTCANLAGVAIVNSYALSVTNSVVVTKTTQVSSSDGLIYIEAINNQTVVDPVWWFRQYTAFDYLVPSYPAPLTNGWYNLSFNNRYYDYSFVCTITDLLDPVNNFEIISRIDPVTGVYSVSNNFPVYEISGGVVITPAGGCTTTTTTTTTP